MLLGASCKAADKSSAIKPQLLAELFGTLQSGDSTSDIQAVAAEARNVSRTDPNWPTLTYLIGEADLKRGDIKQARATFRDLAVSATPDRPASSEKYVAGDSGLAAIGLWRWLQIMDGHGGTAGEVDQALKAATVIQGTRMFSGMVRGGLLPSLPLIEEGVARLLAHVAWKANRKEAAGLFLDFISVDSTGERDEIGEQIQKKMLADGLATPERLDLFRFRRQVSAVKTRKLKEAAAESLRSLWEDQNAPADVRAEAAYEWGNFFRQAEEKKNDVVAALTSAFELAGEEGPLAEKALYRRGMVRNSVNPKQPAAFFDDMNRLLERFPSGRFADDALYQIAAEHLLGAQPDQGRAFSDFAKLQAFDGPNDWLDSAYSLAAIGLFDRGTEADLKEADRLLSEYVERFPDGVFRPRCLFWRGRIAERTGDARAARRFYEQVIDESPYEYYGLRASMHLEDGASAISMALPRTNSATWNKLREAYRRRAPDLELREATPYHERLRTADRSGLYSRVLTVVTAIGKQFRKRLDNIPLQELDNQNLIPAAAILLALRQDAVAARDAALTADNQLRLVGFLGGKLRDWSTAIALTFRRSDTAHMRELEKDERFLPTVYPSIDVLGRLRESLADSAWQIDGSTALSWSLMYSVIRRESGYYAGAISAAGAIGLFQILPRTFEGRPDCWRLRGEGEKPEAYLFDPLRNAQFWSCWVRKEFEPKTRDSIALMLVSHQAGADNLREWRSNWAGRAIERDLELQIDTIRFPATQVFVRNVLADISIVDASGLFETSTDSGRRAIHD